MCPRENKTVVPLETTKLKHISKMRSIFARFSHTLSVQTKALPILCYAILSFSNYKIAKLNVSNDNMGIKVKIYNTCIPKNYTLTYVTCT